MTSKKAEYQVKEHQLFITPIYLWFKLLAQNKISRHKLGMTLKISFFVIVTTPFRMIQWLLLVSKLKKIDFTDKAPVFVIGHWRSGTTHLHYMLSKDKQFACLDSFQAFFFNVAFVSKRIMKPILRGAMPSTRPQDNVQINADSPQEEEHPLTNRTEKSGMQMFFFPKNISYFDKYDLFEGASEKEIKNWKKVYLDLLKKISLFQGSEKTLLLKNPHSTGRIKVLLELFPDAKFIFIHRDPYEVYNSTLILYKKAIRSQFLQEFSDEEIEERVIYCYEKMMKRYLELRDLIPKSHLVEIAYDNLDQEPLSVMKSIYTDLSLGEFSKVESDIQDYLEKLGEFKKNKRTAIDPKILSTINNRWKFAFDEWNYELTKPSSFE